MLGMSTEEQDQINSLLDAGATTSQQKAALKWLADYMEESYILNLPISKPVIQGLGSFSKRSKVDATLKGRAEKLIQKYRC
jgi:hypothetical protein